MKIPVEFTKKDFRNLTIQEKKEKLLNYLTVTALQIEVKRKSESDKVPRFSGKISSEGLCYLLIAEDLFEFHEKSPVSCIFCGKVIKVADVWGTFVNSSKVCSKTCYNNQKAKNFAELNQKTGVALLKAKITRQEWSKKDPFRSVAPPEIMFVQEELGTLPKGSFKWKIAIPDILDLFYLPLQKKKMTELNLNYSPLSNEENEIKEES
ncbi:MAG: hypothetical protein ACXADY_25125 [Candidatus Hodarchaeales archaeon]|jgi:hypothetical protein